MVCACAALLATTGDAHAKKRARHAYRASTPKIAFYLASYGTVKASTKTRALAKCRAKQAAEARKHRDAPGDPTFCQRTLVTVRGPYPRSGYDGDEDDKVLFVYKGSDGGWYDKTGESPCFAAGTPIATPSGEKAIESIAVGEAVYSWDAEAKEVVVGAVTRTKRRAGKRVGTLTFEDGRTVDVTGNHPFYVVRTGEWVEAARLEPGTVVLELRNGAVAETRLVAKTEFAREAVVYDLTVTTHHDYFAAGVLVHNY